MILLMLVLFSYYFMNSKFLNHASINVSSQGLFNGVVTNYNKTKRFSDEQKDKIRQHYAGFWQFVSDTTITSSNVRKSDCVEFKDNGIVWEVIQWRLKLPSGDTLATDQVLTGYVSPYSKAPYDSQKTIAEFRVLHQAFISNSDSCYGKSDVDELWEFAKNNEGLTINHRVFVPYKGEIADFFPEGMIHVVDKLQLNECRDLSLSSFAKRKFQESLGSQQFLGVNVLRSYYDPMIIDELLRRFPNVNKLLPDSLAINYVKDESGMVTGCHFTNKIVRGKFEEQLLNEVVTWKLPPGSDDNGRYSFLLHK